MLGYVTFLAVSENKNVFFLSFTCDASLPFCQLPDASPEQIKKAYYNCMKACHPDLSGDDEETTNFCMFINEIYEVMVPNITACILFGFLVVSHFSIDYYTNSGSQ